MRTGAAVAWEAGKPPSSEQVNSVSVTFAEHAVLPEISAARIAARTPFARAIPRAHASASATFTSCASRAAVATRGGANRLSSSSRLGIRRRQGRSQLPGYVDRYLDGEIKIDEMISAVLPLNKINDAFELMHAGKVIRSVIEY